MKNKTLHVSGIVFISATVNIILNILFIPHWGILGAAMATLISYFVWNGMKIYYDAAFYDLRFDFYRLGHITTVAVALYLTSLLMANTNVLFINIGIKILILLCYPMIFFLTGFFSSKEKEYILKFWALLRNEGMGATLSKINAFY